MNFFRKMIVQYFVQAGGEVMKETCCDNRGVTMLLMFKKYLK